MEKHIKAVQRHTTLFFWLCLLVVAALIALGAIFRLPNWVLGAVLLPLNVLSWPVAFSYWALPVRSAGGWMSRYYLTRRDPCILLLIVTTAGPIACLFDLTGTIF